MPYIKSFINLVLFFVLFFVPLNAKTVNELLDTLGESDAKFTFYFWLEGSDAFLTSNVSGLSSIWYFTNPEKKWQPLYNAAPFDGFIEAKNTLLDVSFEESTKTITIGSINPDATIDSSIADKLAILSNKTFTAKYFFWNVLKNNEVVSFLTTKKANLEMSIWHFTTEGRKWQPIYNAPSTADFPAAPKTLDGVNFNLSEGSMNLSNKNDIATAKLIEQYPDEIEHFKSTHEALFNRIDAMKAEGTYDSYGGDFTTGSEARPESETVPFKIISLRSENFQNGEKLEIPNDDPISPHLAWTIQGTGVKSFAIIIIDLDYRDAKHWVVVDIAPNVMEVRKGVSEGEGGLKNLLNSFQQSSYVKPFPPTGETHNYKVTLYALSIENTRDIQDVFENVLDKYSVSFKYTSAGFGSRR